MARRTQTETWELWMTRIREGLRYRKDKGNDPEWKLAHEYFRNEFEEGVDPENDDYTLQVTSPCIDAGNPDPAYNDPEDPENQGWSRPG